MADDLDRKVLGSFARSRVPVVAVNDQGLVVACSDSFASFLDKDSTLRLRGQKIEGISSDSEYVANWWKAFSKGKTMSGRLPLCKDGEEQSMPFHVSSNVAPGLHLFTFFFPEELLRQKAGPKNLTARESQALSLVARGEQNPEIAKEMGVSIESVKTYTNRARAKLGARTRAEAVALGLAFSVFDLPLQRKRRHKQRS